MTIDVKPDWWKTLFDEVYLLTDARSVCDDKLTAREVDLILKLLPMKPDQRILDLCGGHGRHSLELRLRGFKECWLLDYSKPLVAHAHRQSCEKSCQVKCLCGDARYTAFPDNFFDHVLILGNSLGYMNEPDADVGILLETRRILQPGGWVLLDIADGNIVKRRFNPMAWHEIENDIVVCRQRELRDNRVYARELVLSKKDGLIRDATYSIRLYDPPGLRDLLQRSGFHHIAIHTDFTPHWKKGDYGFMNHRIIAMGRKPV